MLEPSLVEKVRRDMDELNKMCVFYVNIEREYAVLTEKRKKLEMERKEVEEEQKKEDKFLEVVLRYQPKKSRVDEVFKNLQNTISHLESLSDSLNGARTDILRKVKELRFPIDPHSSSVNGSITKFKTIEGAAFEEDTLRTLCGLLDLSYPLNFEGVTFYPNEVVVNATSMDEAMNRIVQSIQTLRFKISDLLNAYSNIDKLCERVRSSNRYPPILEALFVSKRSLSVKELTQRTGLSKNMIYNTCYNMLRDSWSPKLIKKTSHSGFSLTTTGEITMKRYTEKYGFSLPSTQKELHKELEQVTMLAEESPTED